MTKIFSLRLAPMMLSFSILVLNPLARAWESPVSNADLRVMSFNIRYDNPTDGVNSWTNRQKILVETIRNFGPDLLGTQETLAHQRDYLAKELPDYDCIAAGRDDGREKGEMMAIYYRKSRFQKLAQGHFWLSETPDKPGSKSWDSSLPRMVTWVRLKDIANPNSPPIAFFNTHFDHRGSVARLKSAELLRQKMASIANTDLVVLTGDFNTNANSPVHATLFSSNNTGNLTLTDTYASLNPDNKAASGTYSGFNPQNINGPRIDWIGCSSLWQIREAIINHFSSNDRTPSDHFPITAVLRYSHASTPPKTLKILCYNIHHGRGTDDRIDLTRIAKVITQANPDLVALQEVDRNTSRSGKTDQPAELARLTGMNSIFGKQIDYSGGDYGQAVLARWPIRSSKIHLLPGEPEREQRIAFETIININGTDLLFVSTHLHHISDNFRLQQATEINRLFQSEKRPVILAGDLNANPDSKPLNLLRQYWSIGNSNPELLTYPSDKPIKQIDYIIFKPSARFRVISQQVIPEPIASDHRPVLVELEWVD